MTDTAKTPSIPNIYDDILPLPEGWAEEHAGEEWTFRYVVTLDELIDCNGIEGMNEMLDETLGMIYLTDIGYAFATPDRDDDLGDGAILIAATGVVAEL
jgi:hypothetical protein